jgi:hypothetical protein
MIRTNFANALELGPATQELPWVAPVAASPSKSPVLLLGVLGAVIVAAGAYFGWTWYQSQSQVVVETPVENISSAAAEVVAPVKDQPTEIAEESIGEIPLVVDKQGQKSLNSAALLQGLSPASVHQAGIKVLAELLANTPSGVRYSKVVWRAPQFLMLEGVVDQKADYEKWSKSIQSLWPRTEIKKPIDLAGGSVAFAVYASHVRPLAAESKSISVDGANAQALTFANTIGKNLGVSYKDLSPVKAQDEAGWVHYQVETEGVSVPKLMAGLKAAQAKAPQTALSGLVIEAVELEKIKVQIQFAVWVGLQ